MDIWDKRKRSEVMSKIRSKDTKPELVFRKALFNKGFRYRMHVKDLPGKPDIVLPKYKTVIFVHGCFWHYHENCSEGRIPDTNSKFWRDKLIKNVERDKKNQKGLEQKGWNVIVVWECEIEKKLKETLENVEKQLNIRQHTLYSNNTQ